MAMASENEVFELSKKKGFKLIDQALECEEKGDDSLAPVFYDCGIQELQKCLNFVETISDNKVHRWKDELVSTLKNAQERLACLQLQKHKISNQSELTCSSNAQGKGDKSSTESPNLESPALRRPRWTDRPFPSPGESYACEQADTNSFARGTKNFLRPTLASTLRCKDINSESHRGQHHRSPNFRAGRGRRYGCPKPKEHFNKETNSMLDYLESTIVDVDTGVSSFSDVIGLEKPKKALRAMIILPSLRPDLFEGLRSPPQGLLLFGPPGNGKTMLVKALASEAKSTLFNVTAASLTSKFLGESEKLVRSLFELAKKKAPSIIFIDEIDSILCARRETDHEASRRLKTEFFASFDGLLSFKNDRIVVIGATNRPTELDEAALRRFTKRIYVPLPDESTRRELLSHLLNVSNVLLNTSEVSEIARMTENYSFCDLEKLTHEAALTPIRELNHEELLRVSKDQIRPIQIQDFIAAMKMIRASVNLQNLTVLEDWNHKYGDVS